MVHRLKTSSIPSPPRWIAPCRMRCMARSVSISIPAPAPAHRCPTLPPCSAQQRPRHPHPADLDTGRDAHRPPLRPHLAHHRLADRAYRGFAACCMGTSPTPPSAPRGISPKPGWTDTQLAALQKNGARSISSPPSRIPSPSRRHHRGYLRAKLAKACHRRSGLPGVAVARRFHHRPGEFPRYLAGNPLPRLRQLCG